MEEEYSFKKVMYKNQEKIIFGTIGGGLLGAGGGYFIEQTLDKSNSENSVIKVIKDHPGYCTIGAAILCSAAGALGTVFSLGQESQKKKNKNEEKNNLKVLIKQYTKEIENIEQDTDINDFDKSVEITALKRLLKKAKESLDQLENESK